MKKNYFGRYLSAILFFVLVGVANSLSAAELIIAPVTLKAPSGNSANYPSIQSAYNDIDFSALAGAYTIELSSAYSSTAETLPISLTAKALASETNSITIRPASGATVTISAASKIISFNGAKFVTIDGRAGGTGTEQALTIENTGIGATETTIDFVNDALKNKLQYCKVLGAQVIPTGGSTADPTSGTIVIGTTTGTEARGGDATVGFTGSGNMYNTIDNCNIGNASTGLPTAGVCMIGTAVFTNEGNTVSNCNIYNYFNPTNNYSCAVYIGVNSPSSVITTNKMYQEAARTFTSWGIHAPIYLKSKTKEVSYNTIGYANSTGTDTYTIGGAISHKFQGMNLSANVSTMKGNVLSNIDISTTSVGGSNIGIAVGIFYAGDSFPIGDAANPNIIRNFSLNSTKTPTSTFSLAGVSSTCYTGGLISNIIIDNLKVNLTGTDAATIRGILYGIYAINSWGITAKQNKITNLAVGQQGNSGAHIITAISAAPQFNQPVIAEQNEIYNLNAISTGAAVVTGLFCNSGTGASVIKNNVLALGTNMASGGEIRAIFKSNVGGLKIYHNSIYIGGAATGTTGNTYCYYRNAATPTAAGEEVKNNIFVNKRTGGATGMHYAFKMQNVADYSDGFIAFTNNLLEVDAASKLAHIGADILDYSAFTTSYANFASGCVNAAPLFVDATAAMPNLHLGSTTTANAAGVEITEVTTDFAGLVRADYSPVDLGAYIVDKPTALTTAKNNENIYVANKRVVFEKLNGQQAHIYSVSGQLVQSVNIQSDYQTQQLPAGIFVVRVLNQTKKIALN